MIELIADYHTHTVYSHGKGTIVDNVLAARKRGLKGIAITDHGFNHLLFGVNRGKLKRMRQEVDEINEKHDGIEVLLGMECNIISKDGRIDIDDDSIEYLDILALGFHMMARLINISDYYTIYGKNYFSRFSKKNVQKIAEYNTETMIKALNKYNVDFITHPGARIPMNIKRLAVEAANTETALEINSKSNAMSISDIRMAAEIGVKFVINSDAHIPLDVGNFERGIKIAKEAGLTKEQILNAAK